MIRFIWGILCLILAGGTGQATSPSISFFRSYSAAEAAELQQKLAVLSPAEFRNQLQSQIAPDQPPLWIGPYTEPVVVDTFRLLTPERAAELLPVLWELDDKIIPEEKVLFAAACFKALPERERHPAFAKRLDAELKALTASSPQLGVKAAAHRSLFMSRAVGALANLWKGSKDEREWIMQQANNPELDPHVRGAIIDNLAQVLSAPEKDVSASSSGLSTEDTLRWRQLCMQWADCDRLRKLWSGHDWIGELLIPLAQSPEQHWEVRDHATMALVTILGKDDRLKVLLLKLIESAANHSRVRTRALSILTRFWGQGEVLKKLLMSIIISPEESTMVRHEAISQMGFLWKEDVAVRESLAAVVDLPDDRTPVQKAALEALTHMGRDSWIQQCLLKTAVQVKADWPLRRSAIRLLGAGFVLEQATMKGLLAIISSGQEPVLLRVETARTLTRVSIKDEHIKEQFTLLLQSAREDEKVRIACFDALGLVWERKNNEWVKNLLMPLVGPQEKCVALRIHILWFMPQIWHREAWLQEFFKALVMSPDEPEPVHSVVIRASYNGYWRKEEWFKDLLVSYLMNPAQPVTLREDAIQTLGSIWRSEPWLVDLLLPIASSKKENPQVRQQAITTLGTINPNDNRLQDLLLAVALESKEVAQVRVRAAATRTLDINEANLLKKTARSPAEELSVREEAIDVLGRAWGPLTWKERGEFLVSLAGPMEKNERIRAKAAFQLGLIRECVAFGG